MIRYVLNCLSKKYCSNNTSNNGNSNTIILIWATWECFRGLVQPVAVFPYTLHESVHDTNGQNCCGWMCKYKILCLWKWAWQCNLPLTPDLFWGSTETKPCQTNHVTCDAQVVYASNIFVLDQWKWDNKRQRLSFDTRLHRWSYNENVRRGRV